MERRPGPVATALLTGFALVAFALNSILCRLALGGGAIDAASFTTVRLGSGAVVLWLIVRWIRRPPGARPDGSWIAAGWLFLYALPFSLAYNTLSAGTGALLLFGAVQVTMIVSALRAGERPAGLEWIGLGLAVGGVAYLVSPGIAAPSPTGSLLMVVAGVAWGVYSLLGRGTSDPIAATEANFVRALPFAVGASVVMLARVEVSPRGVTLAIVSGAVTSGLGYVVWYAALRGLTATRAATVQLSVPAITAAGGVLLLSESISLRLVVSAIAILGGIGLSLLGRRQGPPARDDSSASRP